MKKSRVKRLLSLILCAMMILSIMPMSVFAAIGNESKSYQSETHDVFKHTESTLAPGVEQYINYAYAKDGKQMVYYVATADITRDDVVVQTSYLKQHENGIMGMDKLTGQIAYANQKYSNPADPQFISEYYNVVAGVNASFYNMTTGQPMGITYIDGVSFGTNSYDNFFAILKDGKTAVIDYSKNIGNYVDENGESTIWQAAAGNQWLIRDGKDVSDSYGGDYATTRHSRTCVGITAEGKVVTMVLDGRQEPFSCGGTMHELAQIMLEAGCVAAINLDGGGSTTYAARSEGSDAVQVINRPSDGSERSISAGLIIASTAAPSNVFDHVTMNAEDEYVTAGTSTRVTVAGVSPSGSSAEIPADIVYTVVNGTYENGVLTATAAGDVVLTATYNGKEVGSVTIHAVVPESISFVGSTITVPYGKTVSLNLTATYGLNEVKFKVSDISFVLSDNGVGTIDGLSFTAGDGTVSTSTITATIKGTSVSATATINLGKGSEVLWDFEDGDVSEFYRAAAANYNYIITPGDCTLVTAENGKVHSGKYAMRFNADFSVALESGYMNGRLCVKNNSGERIDLKGATRLGMWIYFPIEAKSLNGRIFLQEVTERNEDGTIKSVASSYTTATLIDNGGDWDCGFTMEYDEPGWHYVYFDLEGGDWCIPANWNMLDFYINDRDGSKHGYNHLEHKSQNVNVIMYLDDITVDYSSAVDDRDAPVFSDIRWASTSMSDAVSFIRGKVAESTDNNISFGAMVADLVKDNATGLDESTAKAYVDGVEVACTIKGGVMSVADCVLADGIHTVKFSICDKQGNYASAIRQINVKANSGISTVKLAAHDATLNNILLGSVYYIDLVATDIEKVQSVSADIDLNNISKWELDHMEVAEGFTASYVISDEDENIATITVTRTGKNDATGEGMLVSMPVRTWELPAIVADGTRNNVWMYPEYRKGNEIWPIDISASVVRGEVEFVDGTTDTFTGAEVQVDTEAHYWTNETKPADYATWNGGHDHRAETKEYYAETATNHVDAQALADKAATCTEAGYTGRTFCEVCNSVVDWGTTIPATGHSYAITDGVLKCSTCGDLFNGVWTDGKTYADGLIAADGWDGDSYYKDGKKLTGIQKVPAPDNSGEFYYDFGDTGICTGKYNGLFSDEFGLFYVRVGAPVSGWVTTSDGDVYYMGTLHNGIYYAMIGEVELGSPLVSYLFDENGKLVRGGWHNTTDGLRYYWAGAVVKNKLCDVDGKTYFFNRDGYAVSGLYNVATGYYDAPVYYVFDNVTHERIYIENGIVSCNGLQYAYANGVLVKGLQKIDGKFYYFSMNNYAMRTGHYVVSYKNSNGLLTKDRAFDFDVTYGYAVDANGNPITSLEETPDPKPTTGFVTENGKTYYINEDGTKATGLYQIDGKFYYFSVNNYAMRTGHYIVSYKNSNGLLTKDRAFDFDATYGYAVDANGNSITSLD
ncbi:MAG: phosphodiester glycosidase family protein [Oscillospiraceae bacterium]|nr:phosphodiester glycosidase family protein [Oscillospiraceae bacterium]